MVTTTTQPTTTTTTSLPTFDEIFESGEVHEFTEEEVIEFDFVLGVSDLLDGWGSDAMRRWLIEWDEIGDPEGAISGLVQIGGSFCVQTAKAKAGGEASETVAEMMFVQAADNEEFHQQELTLAAYVSAIGTLCPELNEFMAEGLEQVFSE